MISTAANKITPSFRQNRPLQALAALFAIVWAACAIAPENRFDWLLENLLVFAAVGLLGFFYRTRPLSDLSYALIVLFLLLHAVGAHYTYSKVPLGFWIQDWLSLDRNHFDRVVHFGFGLLLLYPVRETLVRYAGASPPLSAFAAFTVIATASVVYEIIEWIVAVLLSPDAAMAFLGTQGDVFDAQKDSVLAIAGSALGLVLTGRHFKGLRRRSDRRGGSAVEPGG